MNKVWILEGDDTGITNVFDNEISAKKNLLKKYVALLKLNNDTDIEQVIKDLTTFIEDDYIEEYFAIYEHEVEG